MSLFKIGKGFRPTYVILCQNLIFREILEIFSSLLNFLAKSGPYVSSFLSIRGELWRTKICQQMDSNRKNL